MDHNRFKEVIIRGGFELINLSHFHAETRIGFKNSIKENIKHKKVFLTFLVVLKRLSVSFLPSFSKVGHDK